MRWRVESRADPQRGCAKFFLTLSTTIISQARALTGTRLNTHTMLLREMFDRPRPRPVQHQAGLSYHREFHTEQGQRYRVSLTRLPDVPRVAEGTVHTIPTPLTVPQLAHEFQHSDLWRVQPATEPGVTGSRAVMLKRWAAWRQWELAQWLALDTFLARRGLGRERRPPLIGQIWDHLYG